MDMGHILMLFVYFSVGLVKLICIREKFSSKDLPWAQQSTEILILSQHPYWLPLLHYPSHSPKVFLWRSEIQNPNLCESNPTVRHPQVKSCKTGLDPDGNVNPATELRISHSPSLEAQLSPVENILILMFD